MPPLLGLVLALPCFAEFSLPRCFQEEVQQIYKFPLLNCLEEMLGDGWYARCWEH